jgi:hypothetical protein
MLHFDRDEAICSIDKPYRCFPILPHHAPLRAVLHVERCKAEMGSSPAGTR